MKKKLLSIILCMIISVSIFTGCSSEMKEDLNSKDTQKVTETGTEAVAEEASTEATESKSEDVHQIENTEIQVFIAASLSAVMQEIAAEYNKIQPNVKITYNADSSGKLLTQIEEGYECDIFFSAAQKQMDQLEADGLVIDGTRKNVVNNQVIVISARKSGTKVKGLETLKDAKSIALAGGSVPVGKYTRQALINLGILNKVGDASLITTKEVSDALGGVEISEQDNVSKVLMAVEEGSCEVGTTYYSDTYGNEDKIDILEYVNNETTGDVIYPVCQVSNKEADATQEIAAENFYKFIISDTANAIFDKYYFVTNVQ